MSSDIRRERRLRALRAEIVHRLAEIDRLESDPAVIAQALETAPSIPTRGESDFGSDIYPCATSE